MINLEDRKRQVEKILNRSHREDVSDLLAEIERLQAEVVAYQDYISGKITLGQLEAALDRMEVKR